MCLSRNHDSGMGLLLESCRMLLLRPTQALIVHVLLLLYFLLLCECFLVLTLFISVVRVPFLFAPLLSFGTCLTLFLPPCQIVLLISASLCTVLCPVETLAFTVFLDFQMVKVNVQDHRHCYRIEHSQKIHNLFT